MSVHSVFFYVIAPLLLCFKSEKDCTNPQNTCYFITFIAALKYLMAVFLFSSLLFML